MPPAWPHGGHDVAAPSPAPRATAAGPAPHALHARGLGAPRVPAPRRNAPAHDAPPERLLGRQRALPAPHAQPVQRLLHLRQRRSPERRPADVPVGARVEQAAARLSARGGGAPEAEAAHAEEPRLRAELQEQAPAAAPGPGDHQPLSARRPAAHEDGAGARGARAGPAEAAAAGRPAPAAGRAERPGLLPVTATPATTESLVHLVAVLTLLSSLARPDSPSRLRDVVK